eukprot:NODE_11910_length_1258_cov_5.773652.p1 GENE.NODE_11910_length_1258_cov_5.773652~~NODE_11910_length_1258_cov_5.773652.p1  ORF type:complete len:372 (-),score=107.23 NODE_11910_length_1258_cov_5.773652:142-1161(-)
MGVIARSLSASEFDPVVPGKVVHAVFGFCDIRNFTDCCESLEEDTLVFTNAVAHVVHYHVEESGGSVNKNIGDAFLSVWKVTRPASETHGFAQLATHLTCLASAGNSASSLDEVYSPMSPQNSDSFEEYGEKDKYVDGALRAVVEMRRELARSAAVQSFGQNPQLQQKIPGFTVRMGYGLHLGWAVEGAVGSRHKVDATYLSPNVNIASMLEGATKHYGVSILMSCSFTKCLSAEVVAECRAIDRVSVKNRGEPLILYCHMPTEAPNLDGVSMQKFMALWSEGFSLYVKGADWCRSANAIRKALDILPNDPPALALLNVLMEHGLRAPPNWPGYRMLAE